jgi:hypothetical protein
MVKAIIDVNKETNRILNIIKATYDLKTKSDAIEKLAELHAKENIEVAERKTIHVDHFRKLYG